MGNKTSNTTGANWDLLISDVDQFKTERSENTIDRRLELLTNSKGTAIDEVNKCLQSYNTFCDNLDKVYASTERYLAQALANLQAAESDNTIKEK